MGIAMNDEPRIHPTADVSVDAEIGPRVQVWHEAQIREGATLGPDCILGKGVYIDFGVKIGGAVKIQNRASIYHGTTIESGAFIGPHVVFTNDMRPRAITPDGALKTDDDWVPGETIVRYGASIGAGSVILPGISIGRFAMVGAGSVVTRPVPDHGIVVGNPARLAGYACACGEKLPDVDGAIVCHVCARQYRRASEGDKEVGLVEVGQGPDSSV